MNLLAALLVVVRYTLHNVKTFIVVIYCVVLRISFANCIIVLLGLLMSEFGSSSLRTSSVLIIFCSFCGMNWRFFCTFADRRCRSIHARGCLCVALFNILRCFSSFDSLFSRSSNLPPLFLHSFTIKPLDLHWTYTGAALDSPSTATNTYPLSHFTHTTTPSQSVAALQRCSVARNFSKSQKTSIHL